MQGGQLHEPKWGSLQPTYDLWPYFGHVLICNVTWPRAWWSLQLGIDFAFWFCNMNLIIIIQVGLYNSCKTIVYPVRGSGEEGEDGLGKQGLKGIILCAIDLKTSTLYYVPSSCERLPERKYMLFVAECWQIKRNGQQKTSRHYLSTRTLTCGRWKNISDCLRSRCRRWSVSVTQTAMNSQSCVRRSRNSTGKKTSCRLRLMRKQSRKQVGWMLSLLGLVLLFTIVLHAEFLLQCFWLNCLSLLCMHCQCFVRLVFCILTGMFLCWLMSAFMLSVKIFDFLLKKNKRKTDRKIDQD